MWRRVAADPAAFKLPELSQICWACREMDFRNLSLMQSLSKAIRAAPDASFNRISLTVLFLVLPQLDFYDAKLMRFMVRCGVTSWRAAA